MKQLLPGWPHGTRRAEPRFTLYSTNMKRLLSWNHVYKHSIFCSPGTTFAHEAKAPVRTCRQVSGTPGLVCCRGFARRAFQQQGLFMGAFSSHAMSVQWNTRGSTASISAAGFFHGSLHFTRDACRVEHAGFHGKHFSSRIFPREPSLHM